MRSMILSSAVLLNLLFPISSQVFAQEPAAQDQPIRVRTDLIEIRAVVSDKKGNPIPDLKKEDFELLENNKPQELSFFSIVRIPGRNEAPKSSAATAETRPKTEAERRMETPSRTVVLYVDTLHLSIQSLLRIKQELRKFIDQNLTDQDLTAIVSSGGSLGAVEQFTRDRRILRYAVDRLSARPNARPTLFTPYLSSMIDRNDREALQVGISIYSQEENIPPNDPMIVSMVQARARQTLSEATYLRRASLITLREVVDRVADLPGQRLVVLVSDGFTLMDQGGSMDNGDLQSVTSRAVRSGVVIYSIDAKGLAPSSFFDASRSGAPSDPRVSSYVSAGERDLENGLNALARDTGGQAFFNTNDTVGSLGKALTENELYYALAYYPTGEESEKKFRKITLRVKNHPDYVVRAQRGYLPADLAKKAADAEAKTPQQRFVNAILAPLPRTDLGVTAIANYIEFPTDKAQATVTVMIDGNSIKYQEANGRYQFETEVVTLVFNSDGKQVDVKSENLKGSLLPARYEIAKSGSLDYSRRIALKPGLYQIRTGVREAGTERIGTSTAWIEIPNLSKKKITPSSLMLSDEIRSGVQAERQKGIEALPSVVRGGIRYYLKKQPIIYFFHLYNVQMTEASLAEVEMQIEILKDEKPVLSVPWQSITTRLLGKDEKGVTIGGQLGVGLPAGIYELRISLKDSKQKRPVNCIIPFGIEG